MEYFNILPVEISQHIFSVLPIDTVSDCALVSKSWKKLIHSSSFYEMHTIRLIHLAEEAQAEVDQKLKELGESHESARPSNQIYQSSEQLVQLLEDFAGNMNSVRLSEQKTAYYAGLARKCLLVWAARARLPGELILEACGKNQTETEEMMKMMRRIQLSISSGAVSAKIPKRLAGCRPIRRLADFCFGSFLGRVWRKIKKKQQGCNVKDLEIC